jgi:hypothetical protein
MKKLKRKIPGSIEWSGYKDDLDVRHAHKLFFGKPISEVQQYFGGTQSIERADELLFMPRQAFQYCVFAFADFVLSDKAIGDPDSASPFLRLLVNAAEPIDGSTATPAELRRAEIDALVRALGPVGMARFLQQFDFGYGDYTADRDRILGNPTVDDLVTELEHRNRSSKDTLA